MKRIELKEIIKEEIQKFLLERYPAKALDLNKIRNPDGFWKMKIGEGNRIAGTRWSLKVAMAWERQKK